MKHAHTFHLLFTLKCVLSSTSESSPQELLIRTFVHESIQTQDGKGFERSLVTQIIESDTTVMDHEDTIEILYFRDHCAVCSSVELLRLGKVHRSAGGFTSHEAR